MRAMVMPRFGDPDLFEEREVSRPEPGPGEILVRVVAAGTNPIDAKFRADASFVGQSTACFSRENGHVSTKSLCSSSAVS